MNLNTTQALFIFILLSLILACNDKQLLDNSTHSTQSNVMGKDASIESASGLKFTSGINIIFQDSKDRYWFGNNKEGVCFYDGKSFHYLDTANGLIDNNIYSIQEDKNQTIWFGTDFGISSYDGKQFITHTSPGFKDKTKFGFYSVTKESSGDWGVGQSDLWFHGGDGIGVHRWNHQQLDFLALPIEKNDPKNPHIVTDIALGGNNNVWIATYAGVFGYDGNSFTILNEENFNIGENQLHVRAVFEDSKNRLWIGNNSIGVLLRTRDTTINFSEQNKLSNSMVKIHDKLEHVFAIEEDKNGYIWFGDRDTGAWRYDGKSMVNFTIEDGLTSNFVRTIYRDNKDELWFGLSNGDVFQFNGKSFYKAFE